MNIIIAAQCCRLEDISGKDLKHYTAPPLLLHPLIICPPPIPSPFVPHAQSL